MSRLTVMAGFAAVCMATTAHAADPTVDTDAEAKRIAALVGTQLKLSDVGTLQSARASGPNVEVTYIVDPPADRVAFKNAQADHATAVLCEDTSIVKATQAGVSIEITLQTRSGEPATKKIVVGGAGCTAYQFKKQYNKYYPPK